VIALPKESSGNAVSTRDGFDAMSVVALTRPQEAVRTDAPFVRIENISKRFAERRSWRDLLRAPFQTKYVQALNGVTLSVDQGEFFGLLGQNGAGKTTLFKILATLVIPDTGHAFVDGHDTTSAVRQVRRQLVPVVADERSLRWRLDARENLRLYAVLYRVPRNEIAKRIEAVLEVVDLANTGVRMVATFSSGMKQRLLIARALLAQPRVLLLDEPTRGLDPLSARGLRAFLKEEICKRQGCTVLLATHNADEALHLCDRVGILDKGRVLTTGPAERLMEAFADNRYQLWTRDASEQTVRKIAAAGIATDVTVRRLDPEDWSIIEMQVPGGYDEAARAVNVLVRSQVEVARFERVHLSLADLIERVQCRAREDGRA
jgi:ABC-2 type transport system ATP-binding protein